MPTPSNPKTPVSDRPETLVAESVAEGIALSRPRRSYPTLVVLEGPNIDARHLIDRPETWIGRDTDCDIVVADSRVSRHHARIVSDAADGGAGPSRCRLIDNASTNGTKVNGQRIESCELNDGDRILVGKTLFGFFIKDTLEIGADARLFSRATLDALTGLKNRRMFSESLTQEFARARRYGRVFSLVMADLDHFKAVNDTYGHQTGDEVLRQLGRIVISSIREQDMAFRYGGEEVAILLPETDRKGAAIAAERLRFLIESGSVKHGEQRLRFTASFGVATFDRNVASPDALLTMADEALYQAKRDGRNRVVLAPEPPPAPPRLPDATARSF